MDALDALPLEPNFVHEKQCRYLLTLNRYMLEHGFELNKETVERKLTELIAFTILRYDELLCDNPESLANELHIRPFNQLETVINVPKETEWDEKEVFAQNPRCAQFEVKRTLGLLNDIPIWISLDRKISETKLTFSINLGLKLPRNIESVTVSIP